MVMGNEKSLRTVLLLLLSHLSRVPLCATPQTAAHQALPSPGIVLQADNSFLSSFLRKMQPVCPDNHGYNDYDNSNNYYVLIYESRIKGIICLHYAVYIYGQHG